MKEDWLGRWEQGRTGWHEPGGNAALKRHWPELPPASRVLVPLCGKTPDLTWLEACGHHVVGAELSKLAILSFFSESELSYLTIPHGELTEYRCIEQDITIYCGDYFSLSAETCEPCDALYDRGSLVALEAERRADYVRHTNSLLRPNAFRMVIALEYDQSRVDGPPWSVDAAEINVLWPGLSRVSEVDDLANGPPKFRDAGLDCFREVVWLSDSHGGLDS
jgi:thiopurine S-methyltransferase